MTDLLAGPESIDFERDQENPTPGRIRVSGDNFIITTNNGEVIVPRLDLLSSVLAGEGAQSIELDDPRFQSKDVEGAMSELRSLVDHAAASATVNILPTPYVVYNFPTPPGPNGFNFSEFNVAGAVPANATHVVFEVHAFNCFGCNQSWAWWGVQGNQPGQGGDLIYSTNTETTSIIRILLPLGQGKKMHMFHQYQFNFPPSPQFCKGSIIGWMEIPGLSVPLDHIP